MLGSVSYGRIAFTRRALPAIRPVNHLVDDGDVIIRTRPGAAVMSSIGQVVAYEADLVSDGVIGWSVIVVGKASLETSDEAIARYERLLRPMVDLPMDQVIRIRPELVTGQVLTDM